jgi:NDP-sugar pyrophosphorylase family protein
VQIAILAGGLGTRLGEITTRVPKAMVKIAERPFLEHQIELFRSHGIDDIVLLVGHFSDQIKTHFGDGRRRAQRSPSAGGRILPDVRGFLPDPAV